MAKTININRRIRIYVKLLVYLDNSGILFALLQRGMTMRNRAIITAILAIACFSSSYGQDEWDLQIIGGMFTPGQAQVVAYYSHYALVADTETGLRIFDLTNITVPNHIGTFQNGGWVNDVIVRDSYAYLANWNNGVTIVDVINPTNPTLVDNFNTPGTVNDIYLAGDLLFVADFWNGLVILDVSNPFDIHQAGFISGPSFGSVAVDDTVIYLSTFGNGIRIYSLADTTSPVYKGIISFAYDCVDITLDDDIMYLACGTTGMLIYDISNRLTPSRLSAYNTNGSLNKIAIADTIAYLADSEAGLAAINISNPAVSTFIQNLNTPGSALGIAFYSDYALVADRNMLLVVYHEPYVGIDEINPATPTEFEIVNCYPNPFNPSTTVSFALKRCSPIALDVFDISGRHIANLADGFFEAGQHSIKWRASGMSSGIYFIRLSSIGNELTGGHSTTARVVLLK